MKTFIIIVFLATGGSTSYSVEAFDKQDAIDWIKPLYSNYDTVTVV
jgi:hypothetical protein